MPQQVTYSFIGSDRFSRIAEKVARAADRAAKATRKVGDEAERAGRKTRRGFGLMGKSAAGLRGNMTRLVGVFAGVAAVTKAVSIGTKFQDSLADLSSITGTAGEDLAFLSDESKRLGKTWQTSAAETALGFKLVASAKSELLKDPKGLSKVTESVLLLKNATGLDLATSALAATESLNLFGAGAEDANRFVNVLAAGSKVGASEVFETAAAIRKAGTAASGLGVPFEETNALIQVLAKNGQKAQLAGTGLKTVLLKLEDTGFKKLQPSVVGATQAFENLAAMNLDNVTKMELFGLEGFNVGSILERNVPLIRQWTDELTGTSIASDQAAVRMATISAKARGLGVTISNAVIRTFERLTPQIESSIAGLEGWFDSINEQDMDNFGDALGDILELMQGIGKAAGVVGSVFGFITKTVPKALADSMVEYERANEKLTDEGYRRSLLGANTAGIKQLSPEAIAEIEAKSKSEIAITVGTAEGATATTKATSKGATLKIGEAMGGG